MNLEKFFKKIEKGKHTSQPYSGGILHKWEWDNVEKVEEIGQFLLENGFTYQERIPSTGYNSGPNVMKRNVTRIEYNTIDKTNTFHVEFFDGKGNTYSKRFYKTKLSKTIDIVLVLTVISIIISILSLIFTAYTGRYLPLIPENSCRGFRK